MQISPELFAKSKNDKTLTSSNKLVPHREAYLPFVLILKEGQDAFCPFRDTQLLILMRV